MRSPLVAAVLVVVVLLGLAAAFELAIALEVISMGSDPDGDAPGDPIVFSGALLAMVVGAGLAAAMLVNRRIAWPAALLAPAAAAFLVCDYYTFDPYYLPDLRRYSEGIVPPYWIFGLAALALITGWQVRARSPLGLAATIAVMPLCAMTAMMLGIGK